MVIPKSRYEETTGSGLSLMWNCLVTVTLPMCNTTFINRYRQLPFISPSNKGRNTEPRPARVLYSFHWIPQWMPWGRLLWRDRAPPHVHHRPTLITIYGVEPQKLILGLEFAFVWSQTHKIFKLVLSGIPAKVCTMIKTTKYYSSCCPKMHHTCNMTDRKIN